MNKKSLFKTGVIVFAAALASGCVTTQGQQQGMIGASVGCLAGAALSVATGGKPLQGCAVGAVAGGAIGYYRGYQKDLELAKNVERDIKRDLPQGGTVEVKTKTLDVPREKRAEVDNEATVDVMDKMVVSVPRALVSSKDNRADSTFGRVGSYVATSSAPAKVTVKAYNQAEYDYIVKSIRKGYGGASVPEPSKVDYQFTKIERGAASVEVTNA